MSAEIVPFVPAHWDCMRGRLCDTHRIRAEAVAPLDDVLAVALDTSALVRTGMLDGRAECIMGVGLLPDAGYPWLMKTDLAVERFRLLVPHCRGFIDECLTLRARLRAEVPCHDLMLRRWLSWLGFEEIGTTGETARWELEAGHGH